MADFDPPPGIPERLLRDEEMLQACRARDFARIFALLRSRSGVYPSLIARRCQLTPSRVGEVLKGQRVIKEMAVIERISDGLRIPGHLLGLASRDWEMGNAPGQVSGAADITHEWTAPELPAEGLVSSEALRQDVEFVLSLIEGQLPQHYKSANFFGAQAAIASVLHEARSITRLLEVTEGEPRLALLRTGGRIAEFLGWLFQDHGDFRSAGYWSDRSMEWAQEAGDESAQSYVLFRKANQANAQAQAQKAVGLARAAQRIPGLPPQITALAAQQEAQGYARMRNPKAALAKFDEARALAATHADIDPDATLDTSYCTPTYIEIQRANCWMELGDPRRAIVLFEAELATLPTAYRNDRGFYLARLARAYLSADEPEQAASVATTALAIYSQTGSARTITELSAVAHGADQRPTVPGMKVFSERFRTLCDSLPTRPAGCHGGC
ncbi:tetratricopeptide repeat protein [Streptomyces specialis]|uniref:tetratricopeptide repeat protein n=1 Tax=Streptomyces specialis TaxID=498367 RepID=UPI00073ECF9C|nr:hypothetical protein [Streptomyces specialis]